MTDESLNLPELPEAVMHRHWDLERMRWHIHEEMPTDVCEGLFTADQMRDFVLADRALNRRTPQPDKAGVGVQLAPEVRQLLEEYRDYAIAERDQGVLQRHKDRGQRLVDAIDAALATPPPPGAGEDRRDAPSATGRYFCDGPNGHFYLDDLAEAREVVNIIDPSFDDWTITDTANPFGAAMRGEGNGTHD